ncbi:MAG: nuclear transport factor 2 family protein [Reyranella sp.]|uniref:nuclear transport factor 2 family protein n=1 Tax=Reyranella sp. TaxID=1929291 RepID=UPI001AC4049D|nr:nuclear transport factor 2 family protein [Reyranella sp.]MBN9087766.1 nuclear transport factor 2 family protein [Reyranella sp.]
MLRRRSLAPIALLGFVGPARAQDQPDIPMLRDQLMALEKESWEYLRTHDRAAMRRFLPEDALQIYSDGTRYFKDDVIAYMPNYRLDRYEIEPTYGMRLIGPNAALLIYCVTSRGAARFNRTETSKVLATSLYVRRNGKWWAVLYQETPSHASNQGEKQ